MRLVTTSAKSLRSKYQMGLGTRAQNKNNLTSVEIPDGTCEVASIEIPDVKL